MVRTVNSDDILYNLVNSFYYYLTTTIIKKGSTEKTILNWYNDPQLSVVLEFPDLTELNAPTLAIDFNEVPAPIVVFYGERNAKDYYFNLWGFAGWETTHSLNMVQRDKLISDVISLLEDGVVAINDWDGNVMGSVLGYGTLLNIRSEKLPETGTSLADKYRFLTSGFIRVLEKT